MERNDSKTGSLMLGATQVLLFTHTIGAEKQNTSFLAALCREDVMAEVNLGTHARFP